MNERSFTVAPVREFPGHSAGRRDPGRACRAGETELRVPGDQGCQEFVGQRGAVCRELVGEQSTLCFLSPPAPEEERGRGLVTRTPSLLPNSPTRLSCICSLGSKGREARVLCRPSSLLPEGKSGSKNGEAAIPWTPRSCRRSPPGSGVVLRARSGPPPHPYSPVCLPN